MAFIENLTDEDIEHLAVLSSLEVLTLNVSQQPAHLQQKSSHVQGRHAKYDSSTLRLEPSGDGAMALDAEACSMNETAPCWQS